MGLENKKGMTTAIKIVVSIIVLMLLAFLLISVSFHNINNTSNGALKVNNEILGNKNKEGAIDKIIDDIIKGS